MDGIKAANQYLVNAVDWLSTPKRILLETVFCFVIKNKGLDTSTTTVAGCRQKVVDSMDSVDNLKAAIAERIKVARKAIRHTQKTFSVEFGMPVASLKNYEGAKQIPGGEAVAVFCCAGINANWLLTGEGPMLIADLQAVEPGGDSPAAAPGEAGEMIYQRGTLGQPHFANDAAVTRPAFNIDAFQAILVGILEAGAPPKQAVSAAFEFYEMSIKRGLITADGSAPQGKAAA